MQCVQCDADCTKVCWQVGNQDGNQGGNQKGSTDIRKPPCTLASKWAALYGLIHRLRNAVAANGLSPLILIGIL
jgi:hypothetical protein